MTTKTRILQASFAAIAGIGLFMINDVSPTSSGMFVTRAHAIIGRPLTPMSYAGVARRTTRRAYGAYAAPAYGAAVVAPAYRAPGGCVQVVDVYGRLVTQCY
ncbi:MAG TPA: hypothetical protein VJY34_22035 [Roseiarcus sp.]|nr:hypothetical protein [Roseiarcus sp.]